MNTSRGVFVMKPVLGSCGQKRVLECLASFIWGFIRVPGFFQLVYRLKYEIMGMIENLYADGGRVLSDEIY